MVITITILLFSHTRPPYWTELNLLMISVHFGRKPNHKRVCGSLNRTSQNHYVSELNGTKPNRDRTESRLKTLNSVMRVDFRFSTVTFRSSRVFHSRVLSDPSVDTDKQSSWRLPAFLPNIENVVTNSSCWQCLYAIISLPNKQLLQYTHTLLKSYTVPSALLTQFPKKVHAKLLASAFICHNTVHEITVAFTLPCFIWVSRAIAKHARIVLTVFFSMFKLHCKRQATGYSWCTTWREHVTKTAPERRRHSVGGGGDAAASAQSSCPKVLSLVLISFKSSCIRKIQSIIVFWHIYI